MPSTSRRLSCGDLDREHDLDAAAEVAGHPVGRGEEDLGLVAVLEVGDPRVLEVLVDDADDADVVRDAGHARPQAADAADDQVDPHAGLRGAVEHLDDLGVDQRVDLGDDPRRPALLGVGPLALDQGDEPVGQVLGGDDQLVPVVALRVAGQQVEQRAGVLAELGPAGEEAQVGVLPARSSGCSCPCRGGRTGGCRRARGGRPAPPCSGS